MSPSTRYSAFRWSLFLGFFTLWVSMLLPVESEKVAVAVAEGMGWFLLSVVTGFMGTKIAEHSTKFMGQKQDKT